MKPDLYALVSQYAQDQGIESVSTLMRSVLVKRCVRMVIMFHPGL